MCGAWSSDYGVRYPCICVPSLLISCYMASASDLTSLSLYSSHLIKNLLDSLYLKEIMHVTYFSSVLGTWSRPYK